MNPTEYLDQLDQAHAAWLVGSEGWSDRAIEAMEDLPKLTAALRAVLGKCEQMEAEAPKPQVGGFMAEEFRTAIADALGGAE